MRIAVRGKCKSEVLFVRHRLPLLLTCAPKPKSLSSFLRHHYFYIVFSPPIYRQYCSSDSPRSFHNMLDGSASRTRGLVAERRKLDEERRRLAELIQFESSALLQIQPQNHKLHRNNFHPIQRRKQQKRAKQKRNRVRILPIRPLP